MWHLLCDLWLLFPDMCFLNSFVLSLRHIFIFSNGPLQSDYACSCPHEYKKSHKLPNFSKKILKSKSNLQIRNKSFVFMYLVIFHSHPSSYRSSVFREKVKKIIFLFNLLLFSCDLQWLLSPSTYRISYKWLWLFTVNMNHRKI